MDRDGIRRQGYDGAFSGKLDYFKLPVISRTIPNCYFPEADFWVAVVRSPC